MDGSAMGYLCEIDYVVIVSATWTSVQQPNVDFKPASKLKGKIIEPYLTASRLSFVLCLHQLFLSHLVQFETIPIHLLRSCSNRRRGIP